MPESAAPFSLRLPVVVLQAVDECAKKQGVTRSHVIREACKAYVASTLSLIHISEPTRPY